MITRPVLTLVNLTTMSDMLGSSKPSGRVAVSVNSVVLIVLLSSVHDRILKIVMISEQKMIRLFFIFMI